MNTKIAPTEKSSWLVEGDTCMNLGKSLCRIFVIMMEWSFVFVKVTLLSMGFQWFLYKLNPRHIVKEE